MATYKKGIQGGFIAKIKNLFAGNGNHSRFAEALGRFMEIVVLALINGILFLVSWSKNAQKIVSSNSFKSSSVITKPGSVLKAHHKEGSWKDLAFSKQFGKGIGIEKHVLNSHYSSSNARVKGESMFLKHYQRDSVDTVLNFRLNNTLIEKKTSTVRKEFTTRTRGE